MQRRIALAVAFTLTVVASFAMVVVGRQAGLFGGGSGSGEEAAVAADAGADDLGAALRYLAAINAPAPEPVTEYVYVDEPAGPPQITYVTRGGGSGAAPSPPQAAVPAPPQAAPELAEEDETVEREPEQPSQPEPTPNEEPTAPAPPPSQPQPNDERGEEEFTGTVTAMSGDIVTFSHDGESVSVRVTERDLGRLRVGATAKVHAIRTSSSWVAKEIEVKDEKDGD